jgi:hypothetical protein
MASVARGNEQLVEKLKERGDELSLTAATEIERLIRIWDANNKIFEGIFKDLSDAGPILFSSSS